jgi:predicted nucleic acid-binding protein
VAGAWYFPDEDNPVAEVALQRLNTEDAATPALFWFELRNVFLVGERKGRISETDTARFLALVARLPIKPDYEPNEAMIFQLARTHKLSIYDAAYLELAQRHGLPIATLDNAIVKAARAEKIELLGSVNRPRSA